MGSNTSVVVEACGTTKKDALENLNSKIIRKYKGEILRDCMNRELFVAANGSAHCAKIKKANTGFIAYINF